MKIVINTCYGGFGLSHKGHELYAELVGRELTWERDEISLKVYGPNYDPDEALVHYKLDGERFWVSSYTTERSDPFLVQVVEELDEEANGKYSELKVVEVPDDIEWSIAEYDGMEWVAEKHQTWS